MGAITGSWERCERLMMGKRGTSGDDLGAYACCYMRGTFTQPPPSHPLAAGRHGLSQITMGELKNLGQEPAPQRRQPAVPGAVLLQ
jgi:hypothetical protein